jgi:hypothetical protein
MFRITTLLFISFVLIATGRGFSGGGRPRSKGVQLKKDESLLFRRVLRIYGFILIFAGVFAVVDAEAMRFLAMEHIGAISLLPSAALAWLLWPNAACQSGEVSHKSPVLGEVLILLCPAVFCLGVLVVGAGSWFIVGFDEPNDKLLEQRFNNHRADFERLITMLDQDRQMAMITPRRLEPDGPANPPLAGVGGGISDARWNDYKTLLHKTRLQSIPRRKSGDIELSAWSNGFAGTGTYLVYIHCSQSALAQSDSTWIWPCVESKSSGRGRDDTRHDGFIDVYHYYRIASNWYIMEVFT